MQMGVFGFGCALILQQTLDLKAQFIWAYYAGLVRLWLAGLHSNCYLISINILTVGLQ